MSKSRRYAMKASIIFASVLLGISLLAHAGPDEPAPKPALHLVLTEIQPGTLSSAQYCMLVFDDHNFHAEKAFSTNGKDRDRKVYQGRLSDQDWAALIAILDAKPFRDLAVPPKSTTLVTEGLHPYAISVARKSGFQNLEFLTKSSLKPYEHQVKPLLEWWKSARNQFTPDSNAPADSRCALSNRDAVFNN